MAKERTIYQNQIIVEQLKTICTSVAIKVAKDTDGIVSADTSTAGNLNNTIKMVNSTVDHELTRRYGA